MARKTPIMDALEASHVYIVETTPLGNVTGPFPDIDTAREWIAAPHRVGPHVVIRLYGSMTLGTAERAHHCGSVFRGGSDNE